MDFQHRLCMLGFIFVIAALISGTTTSSNGNKTQVTSTIVPSSTTVELTSSVSPLTTTGTGYTALDTSTIVPSSTFIGLMSSVSTPTEPTSTPTTNRSITYYKYIMELTITSITESEVENKQEFEILNLLITKCTNENVQKNSIYYRTFQSYMEGEICKLYKSETEDCFVSITKLKCGSLISESSVTFGVDSLKSNNITNGTGLAIVKQRVQNGKLGAFVPNKSSFQSEFEGKTNKPETTKAPTVKPGVYVIVTMSYTWRDFCGVVEEHFKERIAERSYNDKGEKLRPSSIVIVNRDKNCAHPVRDDHEEIEVWFIVIGERQDELTIQVGNDLMDLVNSKETGKLGNLFTNKITKVEFGGINRPRTSEMSDTDKIWLAVGIILGVILVLLFFYVCCCRQTTKENDAERGTDYYVMDQLDAKNKVDSVLVNEGFDEHEGGHAPLSQGNSSFKDAPENGNKPVTNSSNEEVSALPLEGESKLAPLGEGEETDDELGMTVPDVAIEPDTGKQNKGSILPGAVLVFPPDASHMAIEDLPKFLEESGNESQKNKEYEDLDQSMTPIDHYPSDTMERNRSTALVPNPETRVKLPGENNYINANFVKDHHGMNSFIVTQHPLSNTMRDFWTVVWDQNVSVIIMVNDQEKDLENYHNYWLDHKNSLTIYGHMQVKTENMESMPSYNLTKFVLRNNQERDVTRTVSHFRFTSWSDAGIPDPNQFAEFVRRVEKTRLENPKSPMVVHCSEGQRYTGVAIAADIGLRVYEESGRKSMINVFDCVEKMRKDRNGIVCTKELYNLIFKVLCTLVKNEDFTDDSKL